MCCRWAGVKGLLPARVQSSTFVAPGHIAFLIVTTSICPVALRSSSQHHLRLALSRQQPSSSFTDVARACGFRQSLLPWRDDPAARKGPPLHRVAWQATPETTAPPAASSPQPAQGTRETLNTARCLHHCTSLQDILHPGHCLTPTTTPLPTPSFCLTVLLSNIEHDTCLHTL